MANAKIDGSLLLCRALEACGLETVFSLPGTQNIAVFEALRQSKLQVYSPTNESAAAFMANGYYRSSGKLPVLFTIPGPGFTYALSGIAEARLDSAAILFIYVRQVYSQGHRYRNQEIDEAAIAAPLVKEVFQIEQAADIPDIIARASTAARSGEPGPVLVGIAADQLDAVTTLPETMPTPTFFQPTSELQKAFKEVASRLSQAEFPLLLLGQGAGESALNLRLLAEKHFLPVITTSSGRGILPEDHKLSMPFTFMKRSGNTLNKLLAKSDLVLALGCRFSANAAGGFRLKLRPEQLIHIDSAAEVLQANYPANLSIHSPVEHLAGFLGTETELLGGYRSSWTEEELQKWHRQAAKEADGQYVEPKLKNCQPDNMQHFFTALSAAMGPDAILVTDTGLHQYCARRHFPVQRPRGLLFPTNFQSMGFCIPAALGARIANPDTRVVALIGDGSFGISGLELLPARRDGIDLTVIVFNDGQFGVIRLGQMIDYGQPDHVQLGRLNFQTFAAALDIGYQKLQGENLEMQLSAALNQTQIHLLEVVLQDSASMTIAAAKGKIKKTVRKLTGKKR